MKKIAIKKKAPSKLPMKKITNEEAERMSIVNTQAAFWPKEALKELATKQLPNIPIGTQLDDKTWKNMCSVSLAYGVKSGFALIKNSPKEYRSLAIQMKNDIEKEFNCDKTYEKALVDQIVSAYIRSLRYSYMLSASQDFEFHGNARNGYFFFLSKESDRAFRQFTSGLELLRSLKQPSMNLKLNIKSNNAFIAEKQQFNNNKNKKEENQ